MLRLELYYLRIIFFLERNFKSILSICVRYSTLHTFLFFKLMIASSHFNKISDIYAECKYKNYYIYKELCAESTIWILNWD